MVDNIVHTEYGLLDGKKQLSQFEATPKNVGRSNETTAEEQAVLEAQALWLNRKERKYRESIAELKDNLRPMLAKNFLEHCHKFEEVEWYMQPKYDGCRAIAHCDGHSITLLSRSGKVWELPHISESLSAWMLHGDIFDGEIYNHDMTFQEITSAAKKDQETTLNLQFHIFDVPVYDGLIDLSFADRLNLLRELNIQSDVCWVAPTVQTTNVLETHQNFLNLGYEGSIIRHPEGVYKFGYRSEHLLKLKDFYDDEFIVVGYEVGKGKFKECPIFICETPAGQQFKVTPKGSKEHRKALLSNVDAYIGKYLKVQYQEMTDDNIPRFPVGLGFRDSRDMD